MSPDGGPDTTQSSARMRPRASEAAPPPTARAFTNALTSRRSSAPRSAGRATSSWLARGLRQLALHLQRLGPRLYRRHGHSSSGSVAAFGPSSAEVGLWAKRDGFSVLGQAIITDERARGMRLPNGSLEPWAIDRGRSSPAQKTCHHFFFFGASGGVGSGRLRAQPEPRRGGRWDGGRRGAARRRGLPAVAQRSPSPRQERLAALGSTIAT